MLIFCRSFRSSVRIRSALRAASTARSIRKAKAIRRGNISTIRFTAATFWQIKRPSSRCAKWLRRSFIFSTEWAFRFRARKKVLLDFRRFGGTLYHRTAFAGASTGQQLLYALDEQVRRYESEGKVKKYEGWEMMSLVLDDHQVCRGVIGMNLQTLELKDISRRTQ